MKIEAIWTGTYPNLCSGEWKLFVDEEDMSNVIPKDKRKSPMETRGRHSRWHFENWSEVWEGYEDGYPCSEWIDKNYNWISKITTNKTLLADVFLAFQANDWRHGECGGCI